MHPHLKLYLGCVPAALDRYLAAAPAMSRFQPHHSLPSKGEEDDERWAGSTTDES